MTIYFVSFPMKNGGFPWLCKRLPEGTYHSEFIQDIQKSRCEGRDGAVFPAHLMTP